MKYAIVLLISVTALTQWSLAAPLKPLKIDLVEAPNAGSAQESSFSSAIETPQMSSMVLTPDVTNDYDIEQTMALDDSGTGVGQSMAYSRKLRLVLREIAMLQDAARAIGGDLHVSITTDGIVPEDLVVPLMKLGYFEITPKNDVIVVKSRDEDPYAIKMRQEVDQLERRRGNLLSDVTLLEKVNGQFSSTSPVSVRTSSELPLTARAIPSRREVGSQVSTPMDDRPSKQSFVPTVILSPRYIQ